MKNIIIISLLLLINNCTGQKIKNDIKTNSEKMEYFDETKYKNLPIDSTTGYGIMDNGDKVQYWESAPTHYVLWVYPKNSPYQYYKVFFFKNKQLKYSVKKFYKNDIGIGQEYDECGKLIKETNWDKDYKFNIEDLAKKMKEEYDVDIMNVNKISIVHRFIEKKYLNIPIYEIWYNYDNLNKNNVECYLINGKTGEILFIIKRYLGDKKGSLLQNYIESFKNKEKKSKKTPTKSTKAKPTPKQNGKPTKKNNTKNIAKKQEEIMCLKINKQTHQNKTQENLF